MEKVFKFDAVAEYNALNNHETLHPLVSVIDFSKSRPWSWPGGGSKTIKVNYGLYCIFLKEIKCGDLKYGCNYYDYQEGSLVFISPGQMVEIEDFGQNFQPKGYALMFHPDMIHGTVLGRQIRITAFSGIIRMKRFTFQNVNGKLCWIVFQKLNMNWNMLLIGTVKDL